MLSQMLILSVLQEQHRPPDVLRRHFVQNAAHVCADCVETVAGQAPVMEAVATQAEALQETLDAVGAVVTESAELDFTGDVEELEPGEAFAVGYQAGQEGF